MLLSKITSRAAFALATAVLLPALVHCGAFTARAASATPPEYVLFVGNSFVRGVKRPLRDMFRAGGVSVRIKSRARNGWTLGRHAGASSTERMLYSRPWDVVFLQEQSAGIGVQRYPDARDLGEMIAASGARTAFFMTWRDRGISAASYDSLKGEPGGPFGYVPIAFELDAPVAPVGWAIRNAIVSGLPFDLWKDGHHLNTLGKYLAACVCYATIMQDSPVGLPAPGALSEFEAAYLQELAELTVLSDPDQWNLGAP